MTKTKRIKLRIRNYIGTSYHHIKVSMDWGWVVEFPTEFSKLDFPDFIFTSEAFMLENGLERFKVS